MSSYGPPPYPMDMHCGPPPLGPHPVHLICPHCGQHVHTKVEYVAGALTWILVIVLFFIGCFFGCCLIPLCVDGCQDVNHYCPNCHHYFGVFRRIK